MSGARKAAHTAQADSQTETCAEAAAWGDPLRGVGDRWQDPMGLGVDMWGLGFHWSPGSPALQPA